MADLMIDYISSLDGYGSAEGWPGLWGLGGPEYFAFLAEEARQPYTLLMGSHTYRLFSEFARTGEEEMAELTARDKIVFSRTLREPLEWANTSLHTGDAVEAVRELKRGDTRLRTVGSPSLCRSLLHAGLVDRYRVVIFPVVNGRTGADRIYDDWPDVLMESVALRTFDGRLQLFEGAPTLVEDPPPSGRD
ncbi:dihydrofolate reductase family protein [Microbacterium sp. 4R-513]|uniref:dihydrofolate reductase family protein n=1 Tax=Microbacterium sp. 4R-513 TaxID=2567934 RepID=UPI0013E1220C|nr:dihydrofolate reductase family protein [Microbacterium sp. 4R-513]QIG40408.1 dihydrofolate reductase family protein [Microbacterium sp. 4R-513]